MELAQHVLLFLVAWLAAVAPLAALVLARPSRRGASLWVAAPTGLIVLLVAVEVQQAWRAANDVLERLLAWLVKHIGAVGFMSGLTERIESGSYFLFNVAIAWILVSVAVTAIAARRAQVPAPLDQRSSPWLRGTDLRHFCLFLAAWLATLMLLVEWRPPLLLGPVDPGQIYQATKQIVWAGLAVAVATLGAAAVLIDTGQAPVPDEKATAPAPDPPDLDAFTARLRERYGQHLLVPPRERVPDRSVRAAPGAAPAPDAGLPRNTLFIGDLTHAHLERIADTVDAVQDRGGVSLVIAPADAVRRLSAALHATLERRCGEILARIVELDTDATETGRGQGGADAAQRYTLIIASDDAVEALLLPNAAANTALKQALIGLELIVVLEFHRLDAALLRLRLRGIATSLEGRTLRVLCQSLPRANLDSAVSNALGVLMDTDGFEALREGEQRAGARTRAQVAVWSNTAAALEALVQDELPPQNAAQRFEATPLLAAAAAQFHLTVSLPDGPGVERAPWDGTETALSRKHPRLGEAIAGLRAAPAASPGEARQCTIIEDRGNLAESLYRLRLAESSAADHHLLLILAAEYPLRDFLLHRLFTVPEEGADLAEVDARLLPIAPVAAGGPTECAIVMADAFSTAPVTQSWVAETFNRLIAEDVARSFRLYPTKQGLEALFSQESGSAPALLRHTNHRHEALFEVQGARARPPRLALPVIAEDGREKLRVGTGDHGLLFIEDSVLHHNGDSYRITSVSPAAHVRVRRETINARLARRVLFQRDYVIDFKGGTFGRLDADVLNSDDHAATLCRALLRGEVARRTVHRVFVAALSRPLRPAGALLWQAVPDLVVRRHMSVLLLRFGLNQQAFDEIAKAELRPRIAFTLAVTLTDVLAALFPGLGERVAVMSPQAAPALEAARQPQSQVADRFVAATAPWLFTASASPKPDDPPAGPAQTDSWIEAQFKQSERPHADRFSHVDLILVEDAFHDLGVLRAVMDTGRWSEQVIGVWHAYLGWVAAGAADHYGYGADKPAAIFAFAEAHALLDRIIQPTERLDPVAAPAHQRSLARHAV